MNDLDPPLQQAIDRNLSWLASACWLVETEEPKRFLPDPTKGPLSLESMAISAACYNQHVTRALDGAFELTPRGRRAVKCWKRRYAHTQRLKNARGPGKE